MRRLAVKDVKSPLRYPGGKSRAVKLIFNYIPQLTNELCSPFFGGGSLELYCASKGIKVYGYDNFLPLVDFWQCLLTKPKDLSDMVKTYHPLKRVRFYELQKIQLDIKNKLERAAVFYVLNRTSFSGSTLSGGMASGGKDDNPRFTVSTIERIRNFKIEHLSVDKLDFKKSISKHPNILLYLDPPYLIAQALYGKKSDSNKDFDHDGLCALLKKRNKWILSYNDSPEIHALYKDYEIIHPKWAYGMSLNKKSKEVLILSSDVAENNKKIKDNP